jgi:hypothetical protein
LLAVKDSIDRARQQGRDAGLEELAGPVRKILEAFDKGLFIRDISRDASGNWAFIYVPYIKALADAARLADWSGAAKAREK